MKFSVRVGFPRLSGLIQEEAFERGWLWCDGDEEVACEDAPYLNFNGDENTFYWSKYPQFETLYHAVSELDQVINALDGASKVKIDGYPVSFEYMGNHVIYRDIKISFETVETIYNKMKELRNE